MVAQVQHLPAASLPPLQGLRQLRRQVGGGQGIIIIIRKSCCVVGPARVLVLVYVCPRTAVYVSSYYMCVLALLVGVRRQRFFFSSDVWGLVSATVCFGSLMCGLV